MEKTKKTDTSSEGNIKAVLTYAGGWITGLIFLLTEKKDSFIRFNAAQSTVLFGIANLIMITPIVQVLGLFVIPVSIVLWIVLMVKVYNNEKMDLPLISDLAKQLEQKIKPQQ